MFAYRLMMAFAIMGALFGALSGTMAYADQDWFGGVDYPSVTGSEDIFTEDQMLQMKEVGDMSTTDKLIKEYDTMGIFLNALYRIFYIGDIIAETFAVPNPEDPTENLFAPYAMIIQIGIYFTYAIGVVQLWRQVNLNSGTY